MGTHVIRHHASWRFLRPRRHYAPPGGVQSVFYPGMHFGSHGPFKPSFDSHSAGLEAMIRICGGFFLILGCMLFTVRWNTINGKLSGLACLGCAANIGYTVYQAMDGGKFVLRPLYPFAAVLALCGLHLMFNANPMPAKVAQKSD